MPTKNFNRRCVRLTLELLQKQPVERKIFIAAWLETKHILPKRNESTTILGRDLMAKKLCPEYEMFSLLIAGILGVESLSSDEIYSTSFKFDAKTIHYIQSNAFIEEIRDHKDELLEVWYTIAAYETFEYFKHLLSKLGIELAPNSLAKARLFKLLESYSVAQLWSIAYKAYQKGCEVQMTQGVRDTDSGEAFITIFLEKGQLYEEKGWSITPFKRWGYPCRQSKYSEYFFNEILGIGNDGFTTSPNQIIL